MGLTSTKSIREYRKAKVTLTLAELGLYFQELDSRMSYGHIGNIVREDDIKINIFPSTFYSVDSMFPISAELCRIIRYIQKYFKELR